jgi:hypothetical protein
MDWAQAAMQAVMGFVVDVWMLPSEVKWAIALTILVLLFVLRRER